MPSGIGQWAIQQAENAADAGMGLILGGINDKRQHRNADKNQARQIRGNKEMMDYSMMKELQMWKDTNYKAQMEQMELAGINPALIYGMKGGGGITTGSPTGGVSGNEAPKGGGEVQAMMGMGIQRELLEAQKENIKANTEKTKVEAAKTAGVDTRLSETQIQSLTQGIENAKELEVLQRQQQRINNLDANLKERTFEDMVRAIGWNAEKIMQEMTNLRYETNINEETWNTKVDLIKTELITALLKNANIKADTGLKTAQTTTQEHTWGKIAADIVQGWKALQIGGRNAETQDARQKQDAWINDVQKSTGIPMEILREAMDGVLRK